MKYRIKKDAIVGQDFSRYKWGDDQTAFSILKETIGGRKQCTADGYGSFVAGEGYGNGCVYVLENDLIPIHGNDTGWVSVKDRLPEKVGDYLTFGEGDFDLDYFSGYFPYGVDYWQPLPAPPEEG